MEWITEPQAWIAFLTLTALELVLGVDNIIFISILVGKLPLEQRADLCAAFLCASAVTRFTSTCVIRNQHLSPSTTARDNCYSFV